MNKHFEDARYYLKRAVEHAKLGVRETVESVERSVRVRTGREENPEPGRVETVLAGVRELEEKAEGNARDRIARARGTLAGNRSTE